MVTGVAIVDEMRFTIIDDAGAVTFTAPPHVRKMLAAAASREPATADDLLRLAEEYDPHFFGQLLGAPAQSVNGAAPAGSRLLVVDGDESRRQSMVPASLGLLVFNLPARRIVQVQNSYGDVQRKDRGRLRRDGRPVRAYYRYALPDDWSIVP